MKTSEILKKALEVIEKPEHWTTGHAARDARGNAVNYSSPDAVSYCLLGAIGKVVPLTDEGEEWESKAINFIRKAYGSNKENHWISHFNDTHTHAEVKEALTAAIFLAEEAEQ